MNIQRPLWQQERSEPDYRFSLANERTFPASIRTALGLSAAGILLQQLAVLLPQARLHDWASNPFCCGSLLGG
ncbi:MAG: DUF202 domain-containing protein [Polaromonas sp.]|uniref:YidH family protein n=1 Tax=Polaromonas sp. TaxID=1869339 RepID=UPI00273174C0|nr:DUF202 domain-containing protein [Polaromonas sp.]MDP2452396.1 DUF202 domain-containing protein [Polaromonas sp.]MDP3248544.1 DUF202 domain-containing protein [Polaromonas sp.]MDP3753815.1 DUF202 domain-containing protein [Polaromonas sp.]MDP3826078.1 DUF202 domain-containing protein [Polaromonas sp.]